MAKRKSWLLLLVLALVAALGLFALTACCGTKYAITWEVSEHATVTVSGYKQLPSEVEEDTTLSFTVQAETGYDVSGVRVNDRTVTADKNGNYSAVVKSDMTVKVETVEKVESVTVKTKPARLTYYAGEELDATGMVVEVGYGSGRKADETEYTVVYKNGGAFALGDTSFTVKFKGVESAAVNLDSAVEVKIELDPVKGAIADEYYAGLQANTDVKNLDKNADGVISFTYSSLGANIALPTEEQWTRGEEGDYIFVDWGNNGAKEIAKDNDTSIKFAVNYKPVLLELASVKYENQEVGEETVPFLIISGKFRVAKTAYLYLYEGNDKVELVGDTVGDESTNKGDEFELKFDMRKLVEKGYLGKWMDIKFVADDGETKETQEIDLNDYEDGFVDKNQVIVNGDYSYSFAVYTPENSKAQYLKSLYSSYYKNEYTLTASKDEQGNPILTVSGTVYEKWAGKSVCIDITDCGMEDAVKYGVINADGTYTVTFNLKTANLTTNGYSHFSIVESESDPTVLLKEAEGNLLNSGLITEGLSTYKLGLIEDKYAVRVPNEKETAVYYVGQGKWGGIVLYGVNEAIATTGVTLETKDDKPMLVVKGTYNDKFTADEVVTYIKEAYAYVDLQNNADSASGSTNTDWGNPTELSWGKAAEGDDPAVPATLFAEAADGEWKIYLDLSARQNAIGEILFSHFGNSTTNLECSVIDKNARITATVGEGEGATQVMYALDDFTAWGGHVVSIKVRTPIDFVKVTTGVKLESAEGKVYLVISGTYTGKAEDGIEELTVDLNAKRNDIQSMGDWSESKFSKDLNNIELTVADNKWSVKIDLSSVKTDSTTGIKDGRNIVHFLGKDLIVNGEEIVNDKTTIVSGKSTYSLDTQHHWDSDFIVINVFTAADTARYMTTGADIEVSEDKVLLTVSGIYFEDKITAEELKALELYYDIQKNPQADHGDWNGAWDTYEPTKVSFTAENGVFTIKYDVTSYDNYAYTMHFDRKDDNGAADFKITAKVDKTVTLGGKKYQLVNFPGSGEAHEYYGCVGLKITDAE